MKTLTLFAFLLVVLLSGCASQPRTRSGTSAGQDHVSVLNNVGHAICAEGVEIEVLAPGGTEVGATVEGTVAVIASDPDVQPDYCKLFTFGKVEVALHFKGKGLANLRVGNSFYGTVSKGDRVLISETRTVSVNGQIRMERKVE